MFDQNQKKEVLEKDIVFTLRKTHGDKLKLYKDEELIKFYQSYFNSRLFAGLDSRNYLYFVW